MTTNTERKYLHGNIDEEAVRGLLRSLDDRTKVYFAILRASKLKDVGMRNLLLSLLFTKMDATAVKFLRVSIENKISIKRLVDLLTE